MKQSRAFCFGNKLKGFIIVIIIVKRQLGLGYAIATLLFMNPVAADEIEIKMTGFIMPKIIDASAGLMTFTTQTETAPTAVAPQQGVNSLNRTNRATWQIGQSRLGASFKYGPKATAKVEVDFFNNNDASPEFALLAPRLRLAVAYYQFSENLLGFMGQDWDIFNAHVNPHTYNFVGYYYQAGNAGFIRQQLGFTLGKAQGVNFSLALGMPQKNDNSAQGTPVSDSKSETSKVPSFAAALSLKGEKDDIVGIAGIMSRVLYSTSFVDSHLAYGITLFTIKNFSAFQIRARAFYGQNMNNLNMQTLTSGSQNANTGQGAYDFREWGGFMTALFPLNGWWNVFFGLGIDSSVNPSGISAQIVGNLLTLNSKGSAGADFALSGNLKAYVELSFFASRYHEGLVNNPNTYQAQMIDVGVKFDI